MGNLLVLLQIGLMIALAALATLRAWEGGIAAGAMALAAAAAALAAWTLAHNRLGNFNIHPAPKKGGVLITSGPYRTMRHPMYTSVLLGAASLAWISGLALGWFEWLALALVLFAKTLLEERWIKEIHPDYQAYALHTRRFVPWLL